MSSHYKQIDGKKYSAAILSAADEMMAGKGDGRISVSDAEALFKMLANDGKYTDLEKDTIEYIRDEKSSYKFTDAADEYFRKEIRSWAAKRGHK